MRAAAQRKTRASVGPGIDANAACRDIALPKLSQDRLESYSPHRQRCTISATFGTVRRRQPSSPARSSPASVRPNPNTHHRNRHVPSRRYARPTLRLCHEKKTSAPFRSPCIRHSHFQERPRSSRCPINSGVRRNHCNSPIPAVVPACLSVVRPKSLRRQHAWDPTWKSRHVDGMV